MYIIIKNVSSSTTHKKTPSFRLYVFSSLRLYVFASLRLSFREFKKILPNTFIYESIFFFTISNLRLIWDFSIKIKIYKIFLRAVISLCLYLNYICIPITFNNQLKVFFSFKKYTITTQTRPTQIVKVYFLLKNRVLTDF